MSRLTAIVIAAVGAAAWVLATSVPVEARSTVVVSFQGSSLLGLPLLSCASQPDPATAAVVAGAPVQFDNDTGHTATVYLDGVAEPTPVAAGASISLMLPIGRTTVALVPECLLNLSEAGTATITEAAAASPTTAPTVIPTATATMSAGHPPVSIAPSAPAPIASSAPARTHQPPQRSASQSLSASPTAIGSPWPYTAPATDGSAVAQSALAGDTSVDYLLTLIAIAGIIGVGAAVFRALLRRSARRGT